jgi:hypothetical protein
MNVIIILQYRVLLRSSLSLIMTAMADSLPEWSISYIGLGWLYLREKNAPTYFVICKKFYSTGPGVLEQESTIRGQYYKTFLSVIYGFS